MRFGPFALAFDGDNVGREVIFSRIFKEGADHGIGVDVAVAVLIERPAYAIEERARCVNAADGWFAAWRSLWGRRTTSPVPPSRSNEEIADRLLEIRSLLEFSGVEFFKFMAYERAAEAVRNAGPLDEVKGREGLTSLAGVGKGIAGRIEALMATGTCDILEELRAKYPATLLEVLHVSGVGMKTAKALFEARGIASLADLESALNIGALEGVARLGPKSIANIKRGILAYKGRRSRTPLSKAVDLAEELIAWLAAGSPARQLTTAGSVRRHEPTVGDIDIICTSEDAPAVMARFVAWNGAQAVLAEGATKASIWLSDGLQIDLRVLQPNVYGNLLQHFTGSREHNIQLREFAVRKGLRVSENGILNLASGDNLTCTSEEEVYLALGMSYVPPEMRTGTGEIEAALDGSLPNPISIDQLRGDFHMHSTWSDGSQSLEEMIESAAARGYEYHSISDHSWGRGSRFGAGPSDLQAQRASVREIGARFGIHTLCSSEVDILPDGSMDFEDAVLAQLDIVIGSVHTATNQSREEMTRRLIRACENPYVSIIGHPTGRSIDGFPGYEFDYDAVFSAAARTGTALEIDGHPNRLDLPSALARRAREYGVTFTCDSDAHTAGQLSNVRFAVGQARRAWITADQVLNARPLKDVLAFVEAKRTRGPQ